MTQLPSDFKDQDVAVSIPPTQSLDDTATTALVPIPDEAEPTVNLSHSAVEPSVSELPLSSGMPTQKPPKEWWQSLSLRTKGTILAIAIGTIPTVIVGATAGYFANKGLEARVIKSQETRAVGVSRELTQFSARQYQHAIDLAKSPVLTRSDLRTALSPSDKERYLKQYLGDGIDSIAVADAKTGNLWVEARTSNEAAPQNFTDRDYFQEAIKTKQPVINPHRKSASTGLWSFYIAVPVLDSQTGELIAVLRTRVPVKYIDEQIRSTLTALGQQTGDAIEFKYLIADATGSVFISQNQDELEQNLSAIYPVFNQLNQLGQTTATVTSNAVDKADYLLGYAPYQKVEGFPDQHWSAVVAEPIQTAFTAQRGLLLNFAAGTLITALIVSALAAQLANRATRPLLSAAKAVNRIGQGDLNARVDVQGEDEIGILGTNINTMAAQLQQLLTAQATEVARERVLTLAQGSGIVAQADLQSLIEQVLDESRQLFSLDRIVIYRFNTGTGSGIIAESVDSEWPSALKDPISDTCIPEEMRTAYQQGRILATRDVSEANFNLEHLKLLERLHVKASLVLPILSGEHLYGLLIAHSCAKFREWQSSEINFLQRLATELGLTIYRVELLEQTSSLAEEQRQLKETLQRRALELLQEVDPISRGDLTTRAKVTADEIGTIADSYNATVDNLRKIVLQVQTAANQVVTTTSASEQSVQALASEALRQAEEIAVALDLVKGMADAVQAVAKNAEQAELAVQQAAQTVEEGDAVMNRTVAGIQVIRATVADTAKKVKHLGESSQKISKVVELISAFAAQTNMLALNASIEASRAGEEGRGFGVVANEVRALARQSAEATEEIRSLISSIQAETNEVVTAMESGIEQVVTGTKLVDETRQSLNRITDVSAQISELVGAITQSAMAQSYTSETVTQTMKDVAVIASRTSSEATQVSSSFDELRKVAQSLQSEVRQFKV